MLGLPDRLFTCGDLSCVAAVVLVGSLSWGGYRTSTRKHDNDQRPQKKLDHYPKYFRGAFVFLYLVFL